MHSFATYLMSLVSLRKNLFTSCLPSDVAAFANFTAILPNKKKLPPFSLGSFSSVDRFDK